MIFQLKIKSLFRFYAICLLFLFAPYVLQAQTEEERIHALLESLAAQQIGKDSFYCPGMFRSYRYYGLNRKKGREDNNIFFTGLITFTLKQIAPKIKNRNDSLLCENIISRAIPSFLPFQNRHGRPTYNFWRTDDPVVFPNSPFLNLFNHVNALPDDLDDTSILLLCQNPSDSVNRLVKSWMAAMANNPRHHIKNTFRKYKHIPAYSTWFGKKMPVDFDFSVLCNTLYYLHTTGLPLIRQDSATIHLLAEIIRNREYATHPGYISPHYAREPVLLFHIARLLGKYPIPELMVYRSQLIEDCRRQWETATHKMDQLLMAQALLWLKAPAPPFSLSDYDSELLQQNNFVFFIAGFNAMMANPFKRLLSHAQFIKYYYVCPAYNEALLLQYLVEKF